MSATESTIGFVWTASSLAAWAVVRLCEASDGEAFRPYVHDSQEAAEAADTDTRTGPTLYRVARTSVLANESTPTPEGRDYAFICSSPGRHTMWTKIDFEVPDEERFNGVWTFPDAAGAVERATLATEDSRRYEGSVFRAYLLTWSVHAVN